MESTPELKSPKTYKREVAVGLILGLASVVYKGDTSMVEVLIWPVTVFTLGAFGMDSYAKQIQSPGSISSSAD